MRGIWVLYPKREVIDGEPCLKKTIMRTVCDVMFVKTMNPLLSGAVTLSDR